MLYTTLYSMFFILFAGYFAKRVGALKQSQAGVLFDFVIMFAMPCLILSKIYHLDINPHLFIYIFMGFISSVIAAFIAVLAGKFLKFNLATLISIFMLTTFGNTLFVGIPIVKTLFGADIIGEVVLYDAFAGALPISIFGPFILSFDNKKRPSIIKLAKKILFFPPFIGLVLGLVCKVFDIPEFVFMPLESLGLTATPVALFAIGLSLSFGAIKSSYKGTIIVVLSKMVLTPLVFINLANLIGLEKTTSLLNAFYLCSMPTATIACALVIKTKKDQDLAVSSVAFGLLFLMVSAPFILSWLS